MTYMEYRRELTWHANANIHIRVTTSDTFEIREHMNVMDAT